jgi:hypothetical protein
LRDTTRIQQVRLFGKDTRFAEQGWRDACGRVSRAGTACRLTIPSVTRRGGLPPLCTVAAPGPSEGQRLGRSGSAPPRDAPYAGSSGHRRSGATPVVKVCHTRAAQCGMPRRGTCILRVPPLTLRQVFLHLGLSVLPGNADRSRPPAACRHQAVCDARHAIPMSRDAGPSLSGVGDSMEARGGGGDATPSCADASRGIAPLLACGEGRTGWVEARQGMEEPRLSADAVALQRRGETQRCSQSIRATTPEQVHNRGGSACCDVPLDTSSLAAGRLQHTLNAPHVLCTLASRCCLSPQ